MNVCLFVFASSNCILFAVDRKWDVKSKMSFLPPHFTFFLYVRDPVGLFSSHTIVYREQECFPVLFFKVSKHLCMSFR
jgi:hypothetical protein